MVGVGVIGYGYWGPNLVRNFAEVPGARVVAVSDLSADRLARVEARYPTIRTTRDHRELLADPAVDAVAVATPVSTHFDLALEALRAGKHVLVEKPLATTSEQAARLVEEAVRRNLVLLVDHTFVYTGAVRKMRELLSTGEMGELYYYDSVRVNLGLFQHDVNVIWDLAVHDLAVMDLLLDARPSAVSATGVRNIPGKQENIAYLTVFFDSPLIAHIHVNWLAPVKVRRTLIGGSRKMIVYDDLEPSEKVKIYDKGITLESSADSLYKTLVGYRTGDMWAPHLDLTEALRVEAQHFLACIEQGECPVADCEAALRVIHLLEAATRSIALRGSLVELKSRRMAA
jgi:predicted dehydrogenase